MRSLPSALILSALVSILACENADPLNEVPMYGSLDGKHVLTPGDQRFIEGAVKVEGSREKAAEHALMRGWQAVRAEDWRVAMRRFNQAWLLTPDSSDVLWGFGAALGVKGDYGGALSHFERANGMRPNNAPILCDYAYTYIMIAQDNSHQSTIHVSSLRKANDLLDQAQESDPNYELIYANRAIAAYEAEDYGLAWAQVGEAMKLGGKSLAPGFIHDLSKRSPKP